MGKLVNTSLFTIPNAIAIGAIGFFWIALVFAMFNLGNPAKDDAE